MVGTLTVLVMGSMILAAVIQIYNRVRTDATRINDRLDDDRLAMEVLQKIAEDVDRLTAPGFNTTMTIRSRYNNGYTSSQLILSNQYFDKVKKPQVYEQITWQTTYDPEDQTLLLYRSHHGLNLEDKVVEQLKVDEKQNELFIPIVGGVTMFDVRAVQDGQVQDKWASSKMPQGIQIGLSFSPLQEDSTGSLAVPEEAISYRTIAIDRSRTIAYRLVKPDFDMSELDFDPNDLSLQSDEGSDDPNAMTNEPDTEVGMSISDPSDEAVETGEDSEGQGDR